MLILESGLAATFALVYLLMLPRPPLTLTCPACNVSMRLQIFMDHFKSMFLTILHPNNCNECKEIWKRSKEQQKVSLVVVEVTRQPGSSLNQPSHTGTTASPPPPNFFSFSDVINIRCFRFCCLTQDGSIFWLMVGSLQCVSMEEEQIQFQYPFYVNFMLQNSLHKL